MENKSPAVYRPGLATSNDAEFFGRKCDFYPLSHFLAAIIVDLSSVASNFVF